MTTGFFTAEREAALSLEAVGPEGSRSFEAIIDTGFTGGLTLPHAWIEELGLPQTGVEDLILADGRATDTPLYDGHVIIGETAYEVSVAEAPTTPLLGTDLLWGFSLHVEFQAGGAVEIAPLSKRARMPFLSIGAELRGTDRCSRSRRKGSGDRHDPKVSSIAASRASGARWL
jgi:clan AA aspartic protease